MTAETSGDRLPQSAHDEETGRQGMKELLKNLLWLLALTACASSQMPAAVAHPRSARPATQFTSCSPNLQIESVKYLGRNNGKDSVQVVLKGLTPGQLSGGFNNAPV